ncbi:short-subunit dehydrogenase [Breznakia sp. PF5-3]|uniref:SDR family NAD(P)-dependent oxidoreductase n=1 Tax=unclassified Breznakia TaxID=2623764 RepID=UPI0024049E53|nr:MULTISPECIES: SDR family oxidoreductase [unclassified Breznakia]MDF9825484.1 short-subunit dehydrogenase [Breznakia sp. PM6-1]MDF9836330.1 short-subunit dehydrogenase [Breznakia sp. PF5-3]
MSTVLITGTTSGIGYELAKIFAQQKQHLILVSRNQEKLEKQKQELEKNYDIKVSIYAFDLALPLAAKQVYEVVKEDVDILINNAGFYEYGKFHEENLEKEMEMIQLHNMFLTELTGLYVKAMVKRRSGKILNIASAAAFAALPYGAVYGATKAYVLSYSKALHLELKPYGVTVCSLCPGATQTEFARKSDIESTPLFTRFVMNAEDVAKVAYKGLMKNKNIIIPGVYNKLLYVGSKLTPVSLINWVLLKMMKKKEN